MKLKKVIGFIAAVALCAESAAAGMMNRYVSDVSAEDDAYYHFTFESGGDGWEGRGGAEAVQSGGPHLTEQNHFQ